MPKGLATIIGIGSPKSTKDDEKSLTDEMREKGQSAAADMMMKAVKSGDSKAFRKALDGYLEMRRF